MVEEKVALNGLILLKPSVYKDNRGLFFESFNSSLFYGIVDEKGFFSRQYIHI